MLSTHCSLLRCRVNVSSAVQRSLSLQKIQWLVLAAAVIDPSKLDDGGQPEVAIHQSESAVIS